MPWASASAGEYVVDIELGAVRRFREASRDATPVAAGAPVPLTFLGAAPSLAGRPHTLHAMGFDVARAFHGTEAIELVAEVGVGDRLRGVETIEGLPDVVGRRGGRMGRAVRRETYFDGGGRVVARTTRTILQTEHPMGPPADRSVVGENVRPVDDGLDVPGDPLAERSSRRVCRADFGPLTMADVVRYAAASADLTAIHYDEVAASSRGYPQPFAMGMLSAAYLGHALEAWHRPSPPWRLTLRFSDLVWPGEVLSINAGTPSGSAEVEVTASCRVGSRLVTSARLELLDRG